MPQTRPPTVAERVGDNLRIAARDMRAIAHRPENFLRVVTIDGKPIRETIKTKLVVLDDEGNTGPGAKHLRWVHRLPQWETGISYEYAIEVQPLPDGTEQCLRHLTICISVPRHMTKGELNMPLGPEAGDKAGMSVKASLLPLYEPQVQVFYPMHQAVRFSMHALTPVPVVNKNEPGAPVTFRTPVVLHAIVDHHDVGGMVPGTTPKRVTLYGADGRPL